MIEVKTETNLTRITILNYESYQDYQIKTKSKPNKNQSIPKSKPNTNNNVDNDNNVNKKITYNNFIDLLKDKTYLQKYGFDMIDEFVGYWTEKTINGKKYKFQTTKNKTFEISKRLGLWSKQDYNGTYKKHKEKLIQIEQDKYLAEAKKNAYKNPMTDVMESKEFDLDALLEEINNLE